MTRICSFAGQFICGNRHCDEKHGLGSYEVCMLFANILLILKCVQCIFFYVFSCICSPYLSFCSLSHVQVNFSYVEAEEQKQALVKLVACKRFVNQLFHNRICLKQFLTITPYSFLLGCFFHWTFRWTNGCCSFFLVFFVFKQAFNWLLSLIVVHYERCAEKLAYKRQKEKENENELPGEKEIDLKDSDKRKRYLYFFSTPSMFFTLHHLIWLFKLQKTWGKWPQLRGREI